MNSNLSILQQNICNSLWCENEDTMNEAHRIFLALCEKDGPPHYKAADAAIFWLNCGRFMRIMEQSEIHKELAENNGRDYSKVMKEVRWFIAGRVPSLFGFNNVNL